MTKPDTTEAVAEALHKHFQKESGWPLDWDDHGAVLKENRRDEAQTAIAAHDAAMDAAGWVWVPREPTEAMVIAADDVSPIQRGTESHKIAGAILPEDYWQAMVEAAQKKTPSTEPFG